MKPLTKQMRKSALAAFFITSLFLFLMLQQSCKKTDSILPKTEEQISVNGQPVNVTEHFFALPANANIAVQRIAAQMRKQNNNKEFITSFVKKNGFAIWDKAIISIGKPKVPNSHLGETNAENNVDTTVIVPLVQADSVYVGGFLKAVIADTVSLDLYKNRDYQALPYAGSSSVAQSNVTTAENFALRMMQMDNLVFGYTKFEIRDKRLFLGNSNLTDTIKISRIVVDFGNNTNFKNFNSNTNNVMQTLCVTVNTYVIEQHCTTTWASSCIPKCDNCGAPTCWQTLGTNSVTECVTWDDGAGGGPSWPEFPSSGGGGTGGGGGTTPCATIEAITESVVPVNCPLIPNPWPPVPTQQQLDFIWMNNHIKDSTNNTCVANTLATLKGISSKLPTLLRNVFDTVANQSFDFTLKMASLGPNEGASTPFNVQSFNYLTKINSDFPQETDLAVAATIIHEVFHCQLLAWYRQAYLLNDTTKRNDIAAKYGYLFSKESTDYDNNLATIVYGALGATQHQDIAVRYRNMIGEALYQFALAKGINVSLDFCKDLAWTGCQDSRAFNNLGQTGSGQILNLINAEKDPYGTTGINPSPNTQQGHPCL